LQNGDELDCQGVGQGASGKQKTENRSQNEEQATSLGGCRFEGGTFGRQISKLANLSHHEFVQTDIPNSVFCILFSVFLLLNEADLLLRRRLSFALPAPPELLQLLNS
jgi:hypothetical protein